MHIRYSTVWMHVWSPLSFSLIVYFKIQVSWSSRKVTLNNLLCLLKKRKKRSWMSLNRKLSGMLKMLQGMMALPSHCVVFSPLRQHWSSPWMCWSGTQTMRIFFCLINQSPNMCMPSCVPGCRCEALGSWMNSSVVN